MTSQPPVPQPGADPAQSQPTTEAYDDRAGLPRTDALPEREPAAAEDLLPQHRIRRTRAGGLWVAVAAAALVLLFLLIFILQNGKQVQVSFFGADGNLPLGVGLLLAAVAGALLVVLVGTARIVQLRVIARRHRTSDAAALGNPLGNAAGDPARTDPVGPRGRRRFTR